MKYRKKPVVIEAFVWTGGPDQLEDPIWIIDEIKKEKVTFEENAMFIETLEGTMTAQVGDYVIKGIKGEIYPCKPDIFEQTYEKACTVINPSQKEMEDADKLRFGR